MMEKINFNQVPGATVEEILLSVKKRDFEYLRTSVQWGCLPNISEGRFDILDLGCGKGEFAKMYLSWFLNECDREVYYTGVDAYSPKLDITDPKLHIDLRQERIQDHVFEVGKYDVIMMSHSMYYIKNELLADDAFLRDKLLKSLKSYGKMIVIAMTEAYNDPSVISVYEGKHENLCTLMKFEKEVYPFIESPNFLQKKKGLYLTNDFALIYEQIASCLRRYNIEFVESDMPTAYLPLGDLENYQNDATAQFALKHLTRGRIDSLDPERTEYLIDQLKRCTYTQFGEFEMAHIAKIAFVFNSV